MSVLLPLYLHSGERQEERFALSIESFSIIQRHELSLGHLLGSWSRWADIVGPNGPDRMRRKSSYSDSLICDHFELDRIRRCRFGEAFGVHRGTARPRNIDLNSTFAAINRAGERQAGHSNKINTSDCVTRNRLRVRPNKNSQDVSLAVARPRRTSSNECLTTLSPPLSFPLSLTEGTGVCIQCRRF